MTTSSNVPATQESPALPASIINASFAAQIGAVFAGLVSLEEIDDVSLRTFLADVKLFKRTANELSADVIRKGLLDFVRRMKERNVRIIPDREYEIKLDEEFTEYAYDHAALLEAQKILAITDPDEAAKIISLVPEQVIPAHYEPGNPITINRLKKTYENTEIGKLLECGMHRDSLGETAIFKQKKPSKAKAA